MNYFFGFSYWKHNFILPFFTHLDTVVFINPFFKKNYFKLALKKGLDKNATIFIWGKKEFPLIEKYAKEHKLKILRVEDGFIRSIGLGSDLTQAYSLVIDSRGIYFDPSQESDIERILNTKIFDNNMLERAEKLKQYIITNKFSKYNLYNNQTLNIKTNKTKVLVPGQVEDDASIKYGAKGMTNLELLKQARLNAKDSYIIYKPHPDVLVGNRIGNVPESLALKYADKIITEVSLDSVLEICDEVHTMTSLVGFEALLREKKVFTYGMPFYAGWGLTQDSIECKRRRKNLSLNELIFATFISYPKYISPQTLKTSTPEELLYELDKQRNVYNTSIISKYNIKIKNYINRKTQLIIRIINYK